ncbi:unnamed protein product, partial [Symbiodinium sp. CCMP2456]
RHRTQRRRENDHHRLRGITALSCGHQEGVSRGHQGGACRRGPRWPRPNKVLAP